MAKKAKKKQTDAEVLQWAALALSNHADAMEDGYFPDLRARLRRTAKRLREMAEEKKPKTR